MKEGQEPHAVGPEDHLSQPADIRTDKSKTGNMPHIPDAPAKRLLSLDTAGPPAKFDHVVTLEPEVEEAIRDMARGNRRKAKRLREAALRDPVLREDLKHPGHSLTYTAPDVRTSDEKESP